MRGPVRHARALRLLGRGAAPGKRWGFRATSNYAIPMSHRRLMAPVPARGARGDGVRLGLPAAGAGHGRRGFAEVCEVLLGARVAHRHREGFAIAAVAHRLVVADQFLVKQGEQVLVERLLAAAGRAHEVVQLEGAALEDVLTRDRAAAEDLVRRAAGAVAAD